MKAILEKCTREDFEYISQVLGSGVSLTNDVFRKSLLSDFEKSPDAHVELITLMDKQIKYYGSSDISYLVKSLLNNDQMPATKIVDDVAKKLNVELKKGGSLEIKLERLVTEVVEKELFSKSPKELAAAFQDIGIGEADIDLIKQHLKSNTKAAILPVLIKILGPTITLGIIETIVVTLIAQMIGREAAKHLATELVKRNPWLNSLGPLAWGLSGAWLAYDLQGPAYRKTVPISLYLGIVALRNGSKKTNSESFDPQLRLV